jgi:hypothetical protein
MFIVEHVSTRGGGVVFVQACNSLAEVERLVRDPLCTLLVTHWVLKPTTAFIQPLCGWVKKERFAL